MTRAMKDSGIEWIGEIPENWALTRLSRFWKKAKKSSLGVDDIKELSEYGGEIICFTSGTKYYFINETAVDGEYIFVNDGGCADIKYYNGKANYSDHTFCFTVDGSILAKFVYYYLLGEQDHINDYLFQGSTLKNLNKQMFAKYSIPFPSMSEQQKIVTFLDEKCSAIDETIAKTEKSIEWYKKLKQSVITKAVTKGIRPNRSMQNSNIEWIGEIPEDWNVVKLRYLYRCQNGISKSADFFGKGFPFVSYKDVYNNDVLPKTVSGLCDVTEDELNRYSVKQGDIFFTRTSETIEEIALTSICLNSFEKATFAGFLIRCRPFTTKLDFRYSKYYMASSHLRSYFVKEMNLVTRASLSQELLKNLQVLIPPLEEQEEIADYLDEKCAEIDILIEKKQQFLTEMENYKKSLIYEYVTGKKEVS